MGKKAHINKLRERLRELHNTAAPGPWEYDPGNDCENCGVSTPSRGKILEMHERSPSWGDPEAKASAALIAELRNALPEILDALDEAAKTSTLPKP